MRNLHYMKWISFFVNYCFTFLFYLMRTYHSTSYLCEGTYCLRVPCCLPAPALLLLMRRQFLPPLTIELHLMSFYSYCRIYASYTKQTSCAYFSLTPYLALNCQFWQKSKYKLHNLHITVLIRNKKCEKGLLSLQNSLH